MTSLQRGELNCCRLSGLPTPSCTTAWCCWSPRCVASRSAALNSLSIRCFEAPPTGEALSPGHLGMDRLEALSDGPEPSVDVEKREGQLRAGLGCCAKVDEFRNTGCCGVKDGIT